MFGDDDALHASASALGWALPLLKRNESVPFMGDNWAAHTNIAGTLCGTMLLSKIVCNSRPCTALRIRMRRVLSFLCSEQGRQQQ